MTGVKARRQGPVIYISNHTSLWDTVVYKCFLDREVFVCGAKPKYFSSRGKRLLMRFSKIIKVTEARQFRWDCLQLLHRGKRLLIYPEMGRNKRLGAFKDWAASIALEANCPVIPLGISGSEAEDIKQVRVRQEEVIMPAGFNSVEALTACFRTKIESLL